LNRLIAAMVCVAALMNPMVHGATLYGLTGTNLVRFESTSPSVVTIIGPHGLPVEPDPSWGVNYLAYHPGEGVFFGVYFGMPVSGVSNQWLFTINPATGGGVLGASLGNTGANQNYFESIEYVNALSSLVISRGLGTFSDSLFTITPGGVTAFLSSNARDNDYTTYDPDRNLFYTIDPNGLGVLETTIPATGTTATLGGLQGILIGDLAYDTHDDALYGYSYNSNHLYRITTTNGLAPIAVSDLGPIGGDQLRGLAVIPSLCIGDVNGDGRTNVADFNILASNFATGPGKTRAQGDLTGDGFVNVADFNILAGDFQCP